MPAFERLARPALEDAILRRRMVIIDEIGKMELASKPFCDTVEKPYTTDAYARINGIGAMIVTHGVGTQRRQRHRRCIQRTVPVILTSGSLPLRAIQRGDLMHHTLVDPEKGNVCRIFAEIAETQARLTPENAAAEIDRLILTAWRRKLSLYLELPSDIPYLQVEVPDSLLQLEMVASEHEG